MAQVEKRRTQTVNRDHLRGEPVGAPSLPLGIGLYVGDESVQWCY